MALIIHEIHGNHWPKCSPWVIINDAGGAFSMGAIGGAIWHGVKGAKNSPRVCLVINRQGEKISGAMLAVKARAPVLGGISLPNNRQFCGMGRDVLNI